MRDEGGMCDCQRTPHKSDAETEMGLEKSYWDPLIQSVWCEIWLFVSSLSRVCLLPSVKVLLMQESVRRIIEAEESRMGKISNISGRGCLGIMFFKQVVGLFDSQTCETVWILCHSEMWCLFPLYGTSRVCFWETFVLQFKFVSVHIHVTLKGFVHIWHKHAHCVDLCVWWT